MLLMMEVARKQRHPLSQVLVLVRHHVQGRHLLVVVIVVLEAQETAGKALAPVKTRKAMASV